jgi:hypothetical protein
MGECWVLKTLCVLGLICCSVGCLCQGFQGIELCKLCMVGWSQVVNVWEGGIV